MSKHTCTVTIVAEGYYKDYCKELEERLKLSEYFARGCAIGWFLTVVIYEVMR
jgi:hypothetical protein